MKVLYFIVCLLLVACSGDNQPEVNQPFELKNIIVGDQQNQQTFENVAPNVAIVLEFSDCRYKSYFHCHVCVCSSHVPRE